MEILEFIVLLVYGGVGDIYYKDLEFKYLEKWSSDCVVYRTKVQHEELNA